MANQTCNPSIITQALGITATGPRTVIVPADPIIWDAETSYEYLTLVASTDFGQGYISKKDVPSGTPLTNTDYWIPVASFNAQLAAIQGQISDINSDIDSFTTRTAEYYGCVPNSSGTDNSANILTALEHGAYFNPDNTYYFSTTINITKRMVYDFCGSNFVYTGSTVGFSILAELDYSNTLVFKNLNVSCTGNVTSVINVGQSGTDNTNNCVFENVTIETDFNGIGFNIQSGFGNSYVNCSMSTSKQAVNDTTMFYATKSDLVFDRCVSRNIKRFAYDSGGNNNYNDCHPWISPSSDITGTVAFDISAIVKVNHVIVDNMQTGFKLSSGASLFGSASFVFVNNDTDTYTYDADGMEVRRASNLFLENYNPSENNHMFKTKQWVDAYAKRTYYAQNPSISGEFGIAYSKDELSATNCTVDTTTPLTIINGVGYFAANVTVTGANPSITLPIDVQKLSVLIVNLSAGGIATATANVDKTLKINTNDTGQHFVAGTIITSC